MAIKRTVSPEGLEQIRAANWARFLRAAKAKFGDRFDYSRTRYERQKQPITIVCPVHGPFTQIPDKHLNSRTGCPRCGLDQRANQKKSLGNASFFAAFEEKFGGRLEICGQYRGAREEIALRCVKHGLRFASRPTSLLSAMNLHGCPKCAREATADASRLTRNAFVERITARFGGAITVHSEDFDSPESEIRGKCTEHGCFTASAASLLRYSAYGCPKCSTAHKGWAADRIARAEAGEISGTRPTRIALMEVEVFGIRAFKLGTTVRQLEARYADALRAVLFEAALREVDALKLEMYLHLKFADRRDHRIMSEGIRRHARWPGDTELYNKTAVSEIIDEMNARITELDRGAADYWHSAPELLRPRFARKEVNRPSGVYQVARPVVDVDSGESFPSATAAAEALGSTVSNVVSACRNGHRAQGRRLAYLDAIQAGTAPKPAPNRGAANARKVICLDDGKVYGSLAEAAIAYGTSGAHVGSVCRGHRHVAGGHRFAYVDDYEKDTVREAQDRTQGGAHYRARSVQCLDTGDRYSTLTEAARAIGVSVSAIWNACHGEAKTAGGRRWRYLD